MKKIKLKRVKKVKISSKIIRIMILVIIFTFLFLNYINKKILPSLMNYAKVDSKKMAINIMNNSINDEVLNILKEDDIFSLSKNEEGEITSVNYNPVIVNKVLAKTSNIVLENLKKVEKGEVDDLTFINKEEYNIKKLKSGVISEIPIGVITGSALLSNIGPKMPVKLNLSGNVVSKVTSKVKNYGINSIVIEVYAHIEVEERVIIPFNTNNIKVVNDIPIAIKIVQGKVPNYYNTNGNNLSVPIENIDK